MQTYANKHFHFCVYFLQDKRIWLQIFLYAFKKGEKHKTSPLLFYRCHWKFCLSNPLIPGPHLILIPGSFTADALQWHLLHSPWLPCVREVGIAAVKNRDGEAGWLTSSLSTLSRRAVPCIWRGSGTTGTGRICHFSELWQCKGRRRIYLLLDPIDILRSESADVTNHPADVI